MPPRVVTGIVKLVVHIPSKHAVAKPTLLGEQTGKLAQSDVLTTNDTVNVREPQLNLTNPQLLVAG